jgi:hypothetical protein
MEELEPNKFLFSSQKDLDRVLGIHSLPVTIEEIDLDYCPF